MTPDHAFAASPVDLAARLNHFTPRDSAPVAEEPPVPLSAPASPAAATPPFRERVKRRAGTAELLLFRVAGELFAFALNSVDEAVEVAAVHPVPEAGGAMLGVVELRGRMVPLLSPAPALGVAPATLAAMLVLRDGARRVGVAVDDVDDVLTVDLAALGPTPDGDAGDGVMLAMARRGSDLVGVVDAEALLAACLAEARTPETVV